MQQKTFWVDHNAWWRCAAQRMADGTATNEDWDEANRRLWCLTRWVPGGKDLRAHDREDLVQTVFLGLQQPGLLRRLAEVDAPAHYLATMMRNHLQNERKREQVGRRASRWYAELAKPRDDQQCPDRKAARNELHAKARYVVNHVLSAEDRKLLTWFYWEGLSAAAICKRLGITEVAVLQRLVRARKRAREVFEKSSTSSP